MTGCARLILASLVLAGVSAPASAVEPPPAAIGDVRHQPAAPKPDVPVLVTARLAEGVTRPVLKLQAVAPGKSVRKSDPEYEKDWTDLPMRDDGKEGDEKAGDGVFSVRVPASYQKHRWLVRYRVAATGEMNRVVQAPAAEDACPNFAWWCDAGPAAWTGSREPGKAPPVTFSPAFLGTLQSVHLLARGEDVARSQWDSKFHKQKHEGTLVYHGVVYDHVAYRNSGQASAHACGKNKWAVKFNRGHHLPLADHDGVPSPAPWDELRLNPGLCNPFIPVLRGIAGLDEVLPMRAYRLAGVPSPAATWVQWRVVTGGEEVSAKDQFAGCPIPAFGRGWIECRSGSSSANTFLCVFMYSARVVHACPLGPTYCRSLRQIGHPSGSFSCAANCVPQVTQTKWFMTGPPNRPRPSRPPHLRPTRAGCPPARTPPRSRCGRGRCGCEVSRPSARPTGARSDPRSRSPGASRSRRTRRR
jgi:hypothetical protein